MEQREQEMKKRREQERRRARTRTAKKQKKKIATNRVLWLVMLSILLIGGLVISAFTFLFPVKTIEIVGNSKYTSSEILAAANIQQGTNLLGLDQEAIEEKIRIACPYVNQVVLKRQLPTTVVLEITEGAPVVVFLSNNQYYAVNSEYELMEKSPIPTTGMVVHGFTVTDNGVGKAVGIEPAANKGVLDSLMKEITDQKITQITQIDLRDIHNIRLLYANKHIWELGSSEKLQYKLKFGVQVSQRETGTGVLNLAPLNTGKDGIFAPKVLEEFVPMPTVTSTDVSSSSKNS